MIGVYCSYATLFNIIYIRRQVTSIGIMAWWGAYHCQTLDYGVAGQPRLGQKLHWEAV